MAGPRVEASILKHVRRLSRAATFLVLLTVVAFMGPVSACGPGTQTEGQPLAGDACPLVGPGEETAPGASECETGTKEENDMDAATKRGVPPIDAAAPDKTETATFALG